MSEIIFDKFNDKNVAPYLAKSIVIKDDNNNIVGRISIDNLKPEYGKRLYRFAVLSDIHFYNETSSYNNQNIDALEDFKNAINFISTKPEKDIDNIEFTCVCGDIMVSHGQDESIMESYKNIRLDFENCGKKLYTCTGNHDNQYDDWDSKEHEHMKKVWADCTGMSENRRDSFTKTITLDNGNTIKDNFYFLSLQKFDLGPYGYMFKDEDINDLASYLEEHKNERTFIFTHCPFPMRAGMFDYKYNNGSYWLAGQWVKKLSDLSYKYKNTIWCSGHTHYQWDCQGFNTPNMSYNGTSVYNWKEKNYDANVWPVNNNGIRECGWSLHIPSCASIRPIESAVSNDFLNLPENINTMNLNSGKEIIYGYKIKETSEFAIIDVYENYIDFRGVTLVGQNNQDKGQLKYNPISQYRLNTRILSETSKYYDLIPLSIDDINNMNINENIDICITCISHSSYHVGSIDSEHKNAAIYYSFGSSPRCGNNVDDFANFNNEQQMLTEMRDLVNSRHNQYSFKLHRDNNGFYITNNDNKELIAKDLKLYWENKHSYFDIEENDKSYTSSTSLVQQTENNKILTFKQKNTNNYIRISDTLHLREGKKDGWTFMYLYKIIRA